MSDRQAFINLQDCVHQYIDQSEQSIHKFYKLWKLAVRAMEQLGLDAFFSVRTVRLPVSANKTAVLPADCLQWSKVGCFGVGGGVVALKRNPRLSNYQALHPDRLSRLSEAGVALDSDTFYNYQAEGSVTHLFGAPPTEAPGTFTVDDEAGVVILSPDCSLTEIALEYLPVIDESQDLYIPMVFREAVIWYIAWNDIAFLPNSRKGTLGDKAQREKNFYNHRRLALARYKPFRADEALDDNRDAQRLTIKS